MYKRTKIEAEVHPRFLCLEEFMNYTGLGRGSAMKDSIGKGSINNNVGRKMSHFTPPTVEEVQEYCFERGNAVDAQSFVDFYTSKGYSGLRLLKKYWNY